MTHVFRFAPIVVWPGQLRPANQRPHAPFKATWTDTHILLDRELYMLKAVADTVVLQCDAFAADVRLDGQLRANAPVGHPGVILSFDTRRKGPMQFPCDRYQQPWDRSLTGWQANVRAIALSLEALRKVERYGVADTGQQYVGWQQLGSGTPTPAAMTIDEAARILHAAAAFGLEVPPSALIGDSALIGMAYRAGAKTLHPDAGGNPAAFRRLTEARDLLEAHL